jgi:hypothetical protein
MKLNKIAILCLASVSLASCSDFLEREPLDFGDETAYFKTAEDLKMSANAFYEYLPKNNDLWGGLYSEDVNSDNQCATGAQSLLYKGDKKTVKVASSEWNFVHLRAINFFINTTESRYDGITGSESLINHYLGEGYFFRAYEHFRLLRNFGDVPILTEMLEDDADTLAVASKRQPRNMVARAIISDLHKAAELMQQKAPESGRVTSDVAYALLSRVALYEATWEKYHAGTCFVPGNSKWVGAQYNPDFSFPAGSAEAEINYFLDECISASEKAIANHSTLDSDYFGMFINYGDAFSDNDEVMLARYYKTGVAAHSCSAYLKGGGGCGVTRAAVNTYLMANGKPIYASGSGYKGDNLSYYELQDRDSRLQGSVRACGSFINTVKNPETGKYENDTIYYYVPALTSAGREKATTGYELNKWYCSDRTQSTQYTCTTAVPLFRSAETMLNYLEAYYERYGNLGGNCDQYWRALRRRAGVDEDYNATIALTDLSQENDLGVYSHGKMVSTTLYNIRRERRCELIAEGQRLNDLKRWRSLDNMVNYQPEGFNLWAEAYKLYGTLGSGVVSQKSVSTYIHPLQINSTAVYYDGYTFPKQHYLEPIPISQFLLTIGEDGNSTLYQNPGWPTNADGTADYSYDCD